MRQAAYETASCPSLWPISPSIFVDGVYTHLSTPSIDMGGNPRERQGTDRVKKQVIHLRNEENGYRTWISKSNTELVQRCDACMQMDNGFFFSQRIQPGRIPRVDWAWVLLWWCQSLPYTLIFVLMYTLYVYGVHGMDGDARSFILRPISCIIQICDESWMWQRRLRGQHSPYNTLTHADWVRDTQTMGRQGERSWIT